MMVEIDRCPMDCEKNEQIWRDTYVGFCQYNEEEEEEGYILYNPH